MPEKSRHSQPQFACPNNYPWTRINIGYDHGSKSFEAALVFANINLLSPQHASTSTLSVRDRGSKTTQSSYHRNQQYSIIGLTNAGGTLVERYSYTAYGTLGIYDPSGTVRTTSTYANRYAYTGREFYADLALYHFRARWYDPSTGGFISRDPLGYVDGMSLYRGYFGVGAQDPSGRLLLRTDDDASQPTNERTITISYGSKIEESMFGTGHFNWTDRFILDGKCDMQPQMREKLESCGVTVGGSSCIKEIRIFGHGCPGATCTTGPGTSLFSSGVEELFLGMTFCKPC